MDGGDYGLQGLGLPREERNCEVAVRRRGEDARYACALGVLALPPVRYLYSRNFMRIGQNTVLGPAPIRIARPLGAMSAV
jgi:hypothetical protein